MRDLKPCFRAGGAGAALQRGCCRKRLLGAFCLAAGLHAGGSQATILLFDQARNVTGTTVVPISSGSAVPQDYGDNVTGAVVDVSGGQYTYGNGGEGYTPNVTVEYFSATSVNMWIAGYGDLTNVILAHAPLSPGGVAPGALNVRLTAEPGYLVELYSFDLAGWSNTDYTIDAVNILGDGSLLYSSTNVLVEGNAGGPLHTSFDFSSPLTAVELLIEIDFSNLAAGIQDNIGMDNIRFGQIPPPSTVVPVPAAGVLFGSGLAALVSCLRRRPARPGGAPGRWSRRADA